MWSRAVASGRWAGQVVLVSAIVAAAAAHAAPGDLDLTFAGTGMTRTGFGRSDDVARVVAVQADGKLVVAGSCGLTRALVRYNSDQTLDESFGTGGKVLSPNGPGETAIAALAIQADGKILVAGYASEASNYDFAVVRHLPDGALDASFGAGGVVTTDFGGFDQASAMSLQADGKIVVAGRSSSSFAVARYHPDGSLDTSFDGDGKVVTTGGPGSAMAIQPNGKIVVAGGTSLFSLVRYNTDGSLDVSFDGDGKVTTAVYGSSSVAYAVAMQIGDGTPVQPDKIVAAGSCTGAGISGQGLALARYNLNGSLDTSFSGDGKLPMEISVGDDVIRSLRVLRNRDGPYAILAGGSVGEAAAFCVARLLLSGALDDAFDSDGLAFTLIGPVSDEAFGMTVSGSNVLLVGSSVATAGDRDFAMVGRDVTNGSLDPSFDGDGKMTLDVGDRGANAWGVAIQIDGKIVVAGSARNGNSDKFGVIRYKGDGSLDASFGTGGRVTHTVGTGSCIARAVAIQPDGRIVVAGFSSDGLTVFRLDQQGALDPSFNGVPVASFGGIRLGIAIQADGRIVVAGESDGGTYSEVAVARYLSDGSLDASFDGDGLVTTSIGAGDDAGLAVAIQTDEKIVVAGRAIVGSTSDFGLVRYRPNGELDDSFGTFGRVMTDIDAGGWDDASGLAIQPDGRIVVAGGSQSDVALARYDTNGALDPTFDGDGKVTTATGSATGIALQADGKVVVTGESLGSAANFAILRYNTDGSLDVGYGSGGRVEIDFDGWDDYAHGIALDGMGRAVIAGDGNGRFGVVRLLGDADLASAPRLDGMPSGSRIVGVAPNPGGGRQSFVVEVARGDPSLSLAIFSVTGQVVFRRDLRGLAPGTHRIAWEGRTCHGESAPPGIYLARLESGETNPARPADAQRIARIR